MNRREFLRRAALIAAGVVAADQFDLLERLTHRKVWTGANFVSKTFALGFLISHEMIDDEFMYPNQERLQAFLRSRKDRDRLGDRMLDMARGSVRRRLW